MTTHCISYKDGKYFLDGNVVSLSRLYDALIIDNTFRMHTSKMARYLWSNTVERNETIGSIIDIAGDDAILTRCTSYDSDWFGVCHGDRQEYRYFSKWLQENSPKYLYIRIGKEENPETTEIWS